MLSPSGVSEGQSIPHWDGWRERGPLTFLVFSNWEEILVIMPSADMYDKRDSTWVTPWRSILNLFRDQFPYRERKDICYRLGYICNRRTTDFSNKQSSSGGKALSLRGKRIPPNSYHDLKIMGQKARKSNSNRSVFKCSPKASLQISRDLLSDKFGPQKFNAPKQAQSPDSPEVYV